MQEIIKITLIDKKNLENIAQKSLLEKMNFKAEYKQIVFLPESGQIFVGTNLKKVKTIDPFYKVDYYTLGALISTKIKETKFDKLMINPPLLEQNLTSKDLLDLQLGIRQGLWKFDKYLKKEENRELIKIELEAFAKDTFTLEDQQKLQSLDYSLSLARFLVEETPQNFNPSNALALIEKEFGQMKNVRIKSFNLEKLEEMGMEGIVAVGKASVHKPILVHLILKPKNETQNGKKIVLVGKGLTYDSGGLDIKTGGYMLGMKADMAGAATMLATMHTLATLELENTEVHWLTAFAENMIDGNSYKADDILTTYSGQTVEVHNTDAEGRLTLADVLAFATTLKPDCIVDAATLTGACIVANSSYFTGLMGNDQQLIDELMDKFRANGEWTINNPLPEILREAVKGQIADLINTSTIGREGGHITAGLFLSHFIDQNLFRNPRLQIETPKTYSWVHLDIAGSSYNKKENQLNTDGATGQSIRSLVDWILSVKQ